jgi:hypothetical protein
MEAKRNAYRLLAIELEGKRPLERPRYRQADDIKPNLSETGCNGMNSIDLAQDRKE